MGTLIGLTLGLGLVLVIESWTPPQVPKVKRARPASSRLTQLTQRAGLPGVKPQAVVVTSAASALLAFVFAWGLTAVGVLGLIGAVAAGWAPFAILRAKAAKRQREHAQAWPDAVDHLASAIRAGLSLPEALSQLGERGPSELRDEFAGFGRDYGSSGQFIDSLDRLKDRLADPVGDRVIEALRIAREVGGGDLGRILRTLSGFLREDQRTRGELESRQSWTVGAARLAVAAPWLVLATMSLQPDVIARFTSAAGVTLLIVGALTCAFSYRLMLQLGRLPTEKRILA
ncbi:MAG TPA: type II secretion system F family protein [Aeromicrobium sp.]|nr:type II secretion system F family protein [Aeromicrobium sp.]